MNKLVHINNNLSSSSSSRHELNIFKSNNLFVYCTLNIVTIIIGIIVNMIVILAYKFGNKKTTNGNSINTNNNIAKLVSNLNGINSKTDNVNRRVSLMIPTNLSIKRIQNSKNTADSTLLKTRRNTEFQSRNHLTTTNGGGSSSQMMAFDNSISNRRNVCSYFILSLGCCDLLICILNMPLNLLIESGYFDFDLTKLTSTHMDSSESCCKFIYFLSQIPIVLEIEILLSIAVDRYSSVFHPIKFYFFDRNKSKLTILVQILISSLLSTPNILFFTSNSNNNNKIHSNKNSTKFTNELYSLSNYCQVKNEYLTYYYYYQLVLFSFFLLNLTIIIVFYIKVYSHIYKVSKHQRIESIGSRTNGSVFNSSNNNNNNNSNVCVGRKTNTKNKSSNILVYFKTKYFSTGKVQLINKEIELESNLKNIKEFDAKEEEEEGEEEENNQIIEPVSKLNKKKLSNSIKEMNSKNPELKSILDKRRISCPLVVYSSEKNFHLKSLIDSNDTSEIINRNDANTTAEQFLKSNLKKNSTENIFKIKQQQAKLNKRIRTCSSRSNEINKNIYANKWKSSVLNKWRRFSENHNSIYSNSSSLNQNYLLDIQSIGGGNGSNATNTLLFRRHTQRIFKHGKTARILGIATLAFTVTWTPFWYYNLNYFNLEDNSKSLMKTDISQFIFLKFIKNSFYLNYVLNPLFYSFVNQRFRRNVANIFEKIFKLITKYCCCYCCFCNILVRLFVNLKNNQKKDLSQSSESVIMCKNSKIMITKDENSRNKIANLKKTLNKFCCFCCSKLAKKKNNNLEK